MKEWAQFFWEHPTLSSSLRTSGPYRWEHVETHTQLFSPVFRSTVCSVSSAISTAILQLYRFLHQKAEFKSRFLYFLFVFLASFPPGMFSFALSLLPRSFPRWRLMWCLKSTTSWVTDRTARRTTALRPGWWTTERSAYLLTYLLNHTATMGPPFNVKVHGSLLGPHSAPAPAHFSLEQTASLSRVPLRSALPGSSQVQSSSAKRRFTNSAFCSLEMQLSPFE